MIVYKFGGASVNSADGVRNMAQIVGAAGAPLFVVVSAMGKTTNALEVILERALAGEQQDALSRFGQVEEYHNGIVAGLFGQGAELPAVEALYARARDVITGLPAAPKSFDPVAGNAALCITDIAVPHHDYDRMYDSLVSFGELISTTVISEYLTHAGIANRWVDMRRCLITDGRHRAADVLAEESAPLLKAIVAQSPGQVLVGQGFIGATLAGEPTTLGREGSDFTAAAVAAMLDAEKVVIWKDVPGILNADPRLFPDTLLIPELTYLDAVELAYSGAQVIHPKTIKPLQNKDIPLYVRPFSDHTGAGSVIKSEMKGRVEVPVLILKKGQVLISIRPRDFSFVLDERLLEILSLFEDNRVKVNLIQTSAVNLSLCVDAGRNLSGVVEQLQENYRVVWNDGLELLTIRGYTPELYDLHANAEGVLLSQRTRRIVRIVRRSEGK